ncbi:MAG TPA: hypothetical protein VFN23_09310, partial [Ktedonobacteraceae bacterium]|nr:hypothetical protein [Ktedonobacteraceae bacterium]
SSPDLDWFREEIRKAYGGRAPRMLDPFSGGGAIPLEAMRLGCEVTAADINPVAWFLLKCTLEYPQRLAGQQPPLPAFALRSREFMHSYFKGKGLKETAIQQQLAQLGLNNVESDGPTQSQLIDVRMQDVSLNADLAWHVRAWGWWVLQRAKADLERFYPAIDNRPTVAYLWARTVTCKNCRAIIPLLKTRWLCKKDRKRVVLTMEPNAEGTRVIFGVLSDVPTAQGGTAQKREHDKRLGSGTMSKSGVTCPCCQTIMTMETIRAEGLAEQIGTVMTAVVVDGPKGREYRLPVPEEIEAVNSLDQEVIHAFDGIPFGIPEEATPGIAGTKRSSSSLRIYGLNKWRDIFTARQLLALGTFVKNTRLVAKTMKNVGYKEVWIEAVNAYLALILDRIVERNSSLCHYDISRESISGTFQRFAFPVNWDFAEALPIGSTAGSYSGQIDWVTRYIEHASKSINVAPMPMVENKSVIKQSKDPIDIIVTDPPYYDAIIYSDLMDFFYVWLRRTLHGLSPEIDEIFKEPLTPKWNHDENDGELIDDPSRHEWDFEKSKKAYEDGMFRAFQACYKSLTSDGRLVIVFAHKQPDAWETLVSAIIRAGFVVDGSWPIQTEMGNRTRALSSAALSSSIWLVCKKRPVTARAGWDNQVLEEMREKIVTQLRDFWDAGIKGPDFVWAATGPAMEAYSKYPVVKKADEPGQVLSVKEFLTHVRRMVLDFVVGRVLSPQGDTTTASGLDDVTTYYLLHRNDFGMESVPVGPCILYAVSCGLSDSALSDKYDILARTGGQAPADEEEEGTAETDEPKELEEGTSSTVRLKTWAQRKRAEMGYSAPQGRPVPMIDQIHRLMHLWKAGEQTQVDEYLDAKGLRYNNLFQQVLQALNELAPEGSDERVLLENISNHVNGRTNRVLTQQPDLFSVIGSQS